MRIQNKRANDSHLSAKIYAKWHIKRLAEDRDTWRKMTHQRNEWISVAEFFKSIPQLLKTFPSMYTKKMTEMRLNNIHCTGQQKLVRFHPTILFYNRTNQNSPITDSGSKYKLCSHKFSGVSPPSNSLKLHNHTSNWPNHHQISYCSTLHNRPRHSEIVMPKLDNRKKSIFQNDK